MSANLVFFADETEVYRSEGVKGVQRLRRGVGTRVNSGSYSTAAVEGKTTERELRD